MNCFSPSETLDIVASVIAAWGAPVLVCGTCCDCDCCGALGWSCAKSVTPGIRNSGTDIVAMARVIMGVNVDGCCGSGQLEHCAATELTPAGRKEIRSSAQRKPWRHKKFRQ